MMPYQISIISIGVLITTQKSSSFHERSGPTNPQHAFGQNSDFIIPSILEYKLLILKLKHKAAASPNCIPFSRADHVTLLSPEGPGLRGRF